VAKDFIKKWKVLATGWRNSEFPLGTIWHAHVVNHPERAALLGWTVDPRQNRPYTEIACFAPCVIYDKEGASEEEVEERPVQDKAGHCGATGEKVLEGTKSHLEKGGGPSEGGNGEASVEGRRRPRRPRRRQRLLGRSGGARRRHGRSAEQRRQPGLRRRRETLRCDAQPWPSEPVGGNEVELRLLRVLEAQKARRSDPHASAIDDLD
jgi:hypothetical protein